MAVLVVAETDGANLPRGTLATITAALAIDPEVDVLVLDEQGDEASEAASDIIGVRSVIKAGGPGLAGDLAENLAPAVVEAARNYGYVLAPAGTWGKNLMPRVAAMLDVQQISDITGIVDEDTFIRPIYAGNALATVRSRDPVKVVTVRGTAFAVAEAPGGSAAITDGPEVAAHDIARFVKRELSQTDRPARAAARLVSSGGQAGCRRGRQPRGCGRRLRPERFPGRPNRQGGRTRAVHRCRYFRGHSAPRGHEGQQGDCRHQ